MDAFEGADTENEERSRLHAYWTQDSHGERDGAGASWAVDDRREVKGRVGKRESAVQAELEYRRDDAAGAKRDTLKLDRQGAEVEHERRRRVRAADGLTVDDAARGSLGVSFGGEVEAGAALEHEERQGATTTRQSLSGGAALKEGKLEGKAGLVVARADANGRHELGADAVMGADHAALGGRLVRERDGDDGARRRDTRSGSVAVGPQGVTLAGTRSGEKLDDKGEAVEGDQASANLTVTGHGVAGQIGARSVGPDGKPTRGAFVGGNLSWEGGLSLHASAGVQKGAMKLSLQGGGGNTATDPYPVGDRWAVDYVQTEDAGVGAGLDGAKIGFSASVSHQAVDGGTRLFATPEKAREFAERVRHGAAPLAVAIERADAALAIPIGESRTHATHDAEGAGITAPAGPAHVGAHGEANQHHQVTVRRVSDTVVEVTVSDGDGLRGGLTGGVGPAEVGVDAHRSASNSKDVKFDLSTDGGKAAYERFQKDGTVDPRYGATLESRQVKEHGVEGHAGLGPLSVSNDATVRDIKVVAGGHETDVVEGDNTERSGFFGRKTVQKTTLDASNLDGREASFALTRAVESTNGGVDAEALAEATGTSAATANRAVDRKASGRWAVSTCITPEQMEQVMAKIEAKKLDFGGDLMDKARAGILFDELRAAKDESDRQHALARFAAELGPEAARSIIKAVDFGPGGPQHDVELEHDKYLTGVRFREENLAAVRELSAMIGDPCSDRGHIATKAADALAKLEERRRALRELDRYTDMPDELRVQELQKTEAFMQQIDVLRRTALAELRGAHEPAAAALASGLGSADGTVDPDLMALQGMMARIDAADAELAGLKAHVRAVEAKARKAEWVHAGAHAGTLLPSSARQSAALTGDAEAKAAYREADRHAAAGRSLGDSLVAIEKTVNALRVELLEALDKPARAIPLGENLLGNLAVERRLVADEASNAGSVAFYLKDVEAQNRARSELFAGYAHELPEELR